MENARLTIQLGNPTGTSVAPQIATFEEAFGDYSNLKGKGRAKRATKRTGRRTAKVARKTEKVATKDAIKRSKIDTRQLRRSDKKQGRQDIRANQQANRMARKMERTDQRQSRKDEKTQRELDRELSAQDQLAPEQNDYNEAVEDEGVGEYGSEGGGTYDDGGYGDGGYDDEGYDDGGYDDEGYDDGGYDDEGYDDGGYDDGGYDDETSDSYNYDEDYGDDGYYDSYDTSMFEGESDMDSVIKPAQEIADKIEWNRKFISKLGQARNNSVNPETIDKEIVKRNERVNELKSCMNNYCCFEGDYENDFSSANGRNSPTPNQIRSRMKIASIAKMRAKRKAGNNQPKQQKTVVSKVLDPQITNGRIVIPPAMSGIDGLPENTGMIATDDYDDYDYGTQLDIMLGADGSKSEIPIKNILIGAVIGVIAIFALKKYKVL